MSRCGIVILAAGGSSRMGVAKQSLEYEGSTLLSRAVTTAIQCKCDPVVVVLGARADVLEKLLADQAVKIVVNPNWQAGMGTSIRAGVAPIRSNPIDAVLIFLCDQPLISAGQLNQMIDAHFASGKSITAAFYAGTFGTPVIFSASLFDELLALEDAQGGKVVVGRHLDQVQSFSLPEGEIDVDTAADFARLSSLDPHG